MGLSATLNIAQAALQTNANMTTVVSRNIAGMNDPGYSRKVSNLTTQVSGSANLTVTRSSDPTLFNHLLTSKSEAAASQALSDGLDQIDATINLTASASTSLNDKTTATSGTSPAALLGTMTDSLKSYAAAPDNTALGQAFLSNAKALATNLNTATRSVQAARGQADNAMALAVTDVNTLLTQFQTVNAAIVKGTAIGADISDALDTRDAILSSLSQEMGITTVSGLDGGMSVYTDGGATLFQGSPRTVAFSPTAFFADGSVGNAVTVDGVPVTGSGSVMPLSTGKIAGLAQFRDTTTVQYQNQLNQIASSLITSFADTDQTGSATPAATIPGLFTYSGAPTMPTTGQTGMAAIITVNSNADPAAGGFLNRIRDGNVGSPATAAYNANTAGAASFSTHLNALLTTLSATQTFNPASGGSPAGTLAAYASSSVSWLESTRSAALTTTTNKNAVVSQATNSLSNSTGVNLDDQLSIMLDLEHSYSASAELMSTVKSLFGSLLSAVQ